MKKLIVVVLVLSALLSLAACGAGAPPQTAAPAPASVKDPYADEESPDAFAPAETAEPAEEDPDAADVDLTQLSSTMVYSEVYAMVYEPDLYIGKTVKMKGQFATQEYNGSRLYACIVKDATACCAQGLEFELAESRVFPDDYPEPGTEITVIGCFDTYREDAGNGNYFQYLVLRNARLL
ncbi:MAG: hypothetical protein K6F56_10125 [Oscillospiraceae bacterium]|nr:hypothetical protein [Oscillospiraceae bacterium]